MSDNLPEKLAFVDIETSGGSHLSDRIIEIGILRVEQGKLVNTFQTLIDPQTHISPFIQQITGIQPYELESAPTFRSIHEQVYELIHDCVFVAHNVRFDYGFIKQELKRLNVRLHTPQLCTAKLSRNLFPQHRRHNLDSLIQRHNFSCEHRHRAFDDAQVLWDFYQLLQDIVPDTHLSATVKKLLHQPSIPMHVNKAQVKNLPSTAGVYIFYGESDVPLYIGKSKNIKKRVLSHFSGDQESTKEMKLSQQLRHIETIPTTGELTALILESQLVKKFQPLYNHKLRNARKLILLKRKLQDDGYYTVEHLLAEQLQPSDYGDVIGVFKSQKQLKSHLLAIANTHKLCQKLLNLDNKKGVCFGYHLGTCNGACKQQEPYLNYNLRFLEATATNKIKSWPFAGPISFTETHNDEQTQVIIDQWCITEILGKNASNFTAELCFDLDIYKILVQFLLKPQFQSSIKILDSYQSPTPTQKRHINNTPNTQLELTYNL